MYCQRRGIAPVIAALAATTIGAPALCVQSSKKAVAAGEQTAVALVNGESITRKQVLDELFANQNAQLNALEKFGQIKYRREVAGSIGAFIMTRMQANGGRPVSVSRADLSDWIFKDKPPILAQTVESLIREKLLEQDQKKKGIKPPEAEIKSRIAQQVERVRQQAQLGKISDDAVIKAVGSRPEMVRRSIANQVALEMLVQKQLDEKAGHKIDKADYLDASHILVRVAGDPKDKDHEKLFEEARKKIAGYREEIVSGKKTFEAAAQAYSDDGSKLQQGELGVFLRGQMVSEFENAAFSLEPGKVSEPVRTPFGWHLIRVNRAGKDTTGPERARALQAITTQRLTPYLLELRKNAKVTNSVPLPEQEPFGGPRPPGRPPVRGNANGK